MSSANLLAVEAAYRAFVSNDFEAFLGLLAEDFTSRQSEGVPWRGLYHGRAGVADLFQRVGKRAQATFTPEEFVDGGDRIVVVGTARITPHGADRCDIRELHIWGVREGVLTSIDVFLNAPISLLQALGS